MLYDPKWEVQTETKADPHSLKALIAWLETKPARGTYKWDCIDGGCLIGVYGHEIGEDWRDLHTSFYKRGELHIVAATRPWTYGAALKRARSICGNE